MKGREAYDVLGPGMVWASGCLEVRHGAGSERWRVPQSFAETLVRSGTVDDVRRLIAEGSAGDPDERQFQLSSATWVSR